MVWQNTLPRNTKLCANPIWRMWLVLPDAVIHPDGALDARRQLFQFSADARDLITRYQFIFGRLDRIKERHRGPVSIQLQ